MKAYLLAALLVLAPEVHAHAPFSVSADIASSLHYLSKKAIPEGGGLAAPPESGSAQDNRDFDQILKLQRDRTDEDCARAQYQESVSLETLFGPEFGLLSKKEVKRWSDFFEQIQEDTSHFVRKAKKHWKRPRPYVNDSRVEPCIEREKSFAYPSGHATVARVFAEILSQLDPSRAKYFQARGEEAGADRVLAGVHHPTDIEAGRELATRIIDALWKIRGFVQEFEKQKRR